MGLDDFWVDPRAEDERIFRGHAERARRLGRHQSGTYRKPVCRYGLASGGPHCGTINQLNFNYDVGGIGFTSYVINTTRVAGSCTDFGDSGGPFIAASSGQLQGTNIGSLNPNTCPSPTDYVHFQPFQI